MRPNSYLKYKLVVFKDGLYLYIGTIVQLLFFIYYKFKSHTFISLLDSHVIKGRIFVMKWRL